MAGKFKFDPCGSCCGLSTCNVCDPGETPQQFLVELSALAEGSCGSCTALNRQFILPPYGDIAPCIWRLFLDPVECGFNRWILDINGSHITVGLWRPVSYLGVSRILWRVTQPDGHCSSWADLNLPFYNAYNDAGYPLLCDGSDSNVTLSAL